MLSLFRRPKGVDLIAAAAHEAARKSFMREWKKLPHETRVFNEGQYEAWRRSVREECGGHFPILHTDSRLLRLGRPVSGLSDMALEWAMRLGWVKAMDGAYYNDLREPHIMSDVASVTLAATNKGLYPVGAFPFLGGQYFARPGKKLEIRLFGRITTAATPGNGTIAILHGTGADANGVSVVASAAHALIASQTNLSWQARLYVHCRSTGAAGTLFGDGMLQYNEAVHAAHVMVPASAPAVSGSIDLTAALIPSVQYLRSGSTAETMQVHDMEVIAVN